MGQHRCVARQKRYYTQVKDAQRLAHSSGNRVPVDYLRGEIMQVGPQEKMGVTCRLDAVTLLSSAFSLTSGSGISWFRRCVLNLLSDE